MKQFYLIVLAFLFVQSSFAQKQTTYEGLDYEIKYPTDWFLSDKADLDVEEGQDIFPELILYAPQYASEGANIVENINLIIGDSDGFSLDDIAALVEFYDQRF